MDARQDTLPGCGLTIWQRPDGFCYGTDAVLLAAFARCYGSTRVLDLGCGTGAIPLLLSARWAKARLTGVDIDPQAVALAARSVADNHLDHRVAIHQLDYRLLAAPEAWAGADPGQQALAQSLRGGQELVVCNPPFCATQAGPVHTRHGGARAEVTAGMQQVIAAAAAALTPNGQFCCIYPENRLAELCGRLYAAGFAVKRLVLVHPVAGRPANRVLCQAALNGRAGCRVEDFVLYSTPGTYTHQALAVYGGQPL